VQTFDGKVFDNSAYKWHCWHAYALTSLRQINDSLASTLPQDFFLLLNWYEI